MSATLSRAAYGEFLRAARRHARRADEAEDLLQDALLAALAGGRTLGPDARGWLGGVLRNQSLMQARSAARRRRRETAWQGMAAPASRNAEDGHGLPADLPPALRVLALLSLSGHSRAEIRHLLRLSDVALRQRIGALKRRLAGMERPAEPLLTGGLAFGSVRRGLLPAVRRFGHFATHDPDGHGIVVGFSPRHAHEPSGGGN